MAQIDLLEFASFKRRCACWRSRHPEGWDGQDPLGKRIVDGEHEVDFVNMLLSKPGGVENLIEEHLNVARIILADLPEAEPPEVRPLRVQPA